MRLHHLSLYSHSSIGIRNTTTVFDNPARDRVRLVRRIEWVAEGRNLTEVFL